MKHNILKQANPCLYDIHPYQPGKPVSEFQREYDINKVIKLASNENPLGPSSKVTQAVSAVLPELSLYPDCHGYELRKALGEEYRLAIDNVILGNGSEEILRMILQAFIIPGQEVIIGQYSFMGYEILAKSVGAHVSKAVMPKWEINFKEIFKMISPKTKMIILANPNNPTGTYFNKQEFQAFLEKLPASIIVVCDEAYYEYIRKDDYPITHEWLAKYPNLIITRTFSKAYGLAGLRVGYALAHEDVIALLNRIRQPFNVNTLAQVGALAALKDKEYLEYSVSMNQKHREQMCHGLSDLGISYIPSECNFVMMHVRTDGYALYEELLKRGIIIRPLRFYRLQHYIRVSVGLDVENQYFLSELKAILAKEKVA